MTKTKTSNRPIFDAASGLSRLDVKDAQGRAPLFAAMSKAGATEKSMSSGGDHYADLRDGVITGWQGAAFIAKLAKAKDGAAMVSGKGVCSLTGKIIPVSMSKRDWSTAISSKVSKTRTQYVTWCTAEAATEGAGSDGKPAAKGKGSGGKGTGGATREVNKRLLDELSKLVTLVKDEKRSKDLACDRAELLKFMVPALDLVSGKK